MSKDADSMLCNNTNISRNKLWNSSLQTCLYESERHVRLRTKQNTLSSQDLNLTVEAAAKGQRLMVEAGSSL